MPFWVVAPEFLAVSDWERHALVADLRGSFTGYGGNLPATIDGAVSSAPTNIDRPDFTGHVDGRLDVTDDTHLTRTGAAARRHRQSRQPEHPGRPRQISDLYDARRHLRRRPEFQSPGDLPPAPPSIAPSIRNSTLTDGTTSTNDDRNFNQYGGVGRVSYELTPGVKPFVEVEGDSRVHDLPFDRNGFARNSTGGYAKAGTSFEFSRLLTGEISVGYAARDYVDPRLNRLQGLLTAASLIWTATPLTTAKFYSTTSIDETTLPGVSGVLTHIYTFEVDHDFRRWLTAIGKFTYGTLDYQGDGRFDKIYSIEGDLIYKMTRNLWIKGTLRRDILNSNVIGSSSASTVVMLGVRVQN